MAVLSSKQVLQENNTDHPNSIAVLSLTHKALSDVACLGEFKNVQRLDLCFNSLTSLEGVKSCVNLKWLSVAQNKLQSLKGIEGLSKLTVLNAAKNKLKSMDEVCSLVSLRALILNDNEIASICKLDQMTDLNTLVLSRNPIRAIGLSLARKNSISKLSLSSCQLQCIDSSLKACTELKELRLSHNEIKTLPSELAYNTKLQNLDIGNNEITRWSDLKVLSSLVNLKNLNLLGNPIAEKEVTAKKIQKLVPNVAIFNAKPINKILKKGEAGRADNNEGVHPESFGDLDAKELKPKKKKRSETKEEEETSDRKDGISLSNEKVKKKLKLQKNDNGIEALSDPMKESKQKKSKKSELLMEKTSNQKEQEGKQSKNAVIDDGETPFLDLLMADTSANSRSKMEIEQGIIHSVDEIAGVVTLSKKKKRNKKQNIGSALLQLSTATDEVGFGGASTWDT